MHRNPENQILSEQSAQEPWFIPQSDGTIRFTDEGVENLRPHFGRAGIDIRKITTEEQYHDAMRRASPWLGDTLRAIARRGPMSVERELLVAVMEGDEARAAGLRSRLERRRQVGFRCV